VSRHTAGVDAKADIPENKNPAIAGFLIGDYRTRTCRSSDFCELLSCRRNCRSRHAVGTTENGRVEMWRGGL